MAKKPDKAVISSEEIIQLSQKVVKRYVNRGSIPRREEEDISMWVVEKFIVKKEKIINNFKGQSRFSTYCISVLNRMCCEVIRKEVKHWNLSDNQHENFSSYDTVNSDDLLLIKEEIRLLNKIIMFHGSEKYKVKLFFTYYYRLLILKEDIRNYDIQYIEHQLNKIFLSENNLSKGQIFINLAEVHNRVENTEIKPDAVRMWLNKNRSIIINRLNKNTGKANYDIDSFQALFEYYYMEGRFNNARKPVVHNHEKEILV